MRQLLRHTGNMAFLVLLQVLLLNNFYLGGYINPFSYLLFLLLLPATMPTMSLMLVSFFLGLVLDYFSGTLGMHAAACVFLSFIRPRILYVVMGRSAEQIGEISLRHLGWGKMLPYSFLLILAHHLFLFFVEVFHFEEFFRTFFRALLSSIFTLGISTLIYLLFFNKR